MESFTQAPVQTNRGKPLSSEERLRLLYDAGRRLNRSLAASVIYDSFVSLATELFSCDGILVSSFDPATDTIKCELHWNEGQLVDPSRLPEVAVDRKGGGMQSQVIVTGQPRIFDVPATIKEVAGEFYQFSPGGAAVKLDKDSVPITQVAVMVPMLLEGEVTGVVQVMSDRTSFYGQDDLELLEGIVLQFTVAAHNAKIYARAEREIEERNAAERARAEAVAATEYNFRALVDSMPVIAWSLTPDRRGDYLNRRYFEYTGLSPEMPAQSGWALVVHPEDMRAARSNLDENFARGSAWLEELRLKDSTGAYRWHLSRMAPIRDSSGEIVRWLGTSTDIHHRKEAEADLEKAVEERTRQLKAAIHELEGFTYSVSHDLRGPLRAINATCALLKEDYGADLPDTAVRLLTRQAEAAKKMAELIDDLLKLSRIGRQEMVVKDVDLSAMAREAQRELTRESTTNRTFHIEEGITGRGDDRLLSLVFTNLFENAIKFTPEGGQIRFGMDEDGASYFVSDDGIGLDMQYADRLFRPFERLVRDEDFPGTGIGLANVKRIIERHRGAVWVTSAPGQGAKFSFTLNAP